MDKKNLASLIVSPASSLAFEAAATFFKTRYSKEGFNSQPNSFANPAESLLRTPNQYVKNFLSTDYFDFDDNNWFKVQKNDSETESDLSLHEQLSLPENLGRMMNILTEEKFSEGNLSRADYVFKDLFDRAGKNFAQDILSRLSNRCFSRKNTYAYSHFLNLLKNISFFFDYKLLIPYATCAISHIDLSIRDSAISLFEGWDYESRDEVEEAMAILENVDTKNIFWLDQYKLEVIEDLQSKIKDFL